MNSKLAKALTKSARSLLSDKDDITVVDLCERYYEGAVVSAGTISDAMACLGGIKSALEKQHGINVILVNKNYFDSKNPRTVKEARQRLASGTGRKAYGIHLVRANDDLLFIAESEWNNNRTKGTVKRHLHQIGIAKDNKIISDEYAEKLMSHIISVIPTSLQKRVTKKAIIALLASAEENHCDKHENE